MDLFIKLVVVTTAILNAVTAKSYFHYNNHRFDKHHEGYGYYDDHSKWPKDQLYESTHHIHHPTDLDAYPSKDCGHYSTDYDNESREVNSPHHNDFDHPEKDIKRHDAQFWDNSRGSDEDSKSWEYMNEDDRFSMPWSLDNMQPAPVPSRVPSSTVNTITTTSPLTILVCMRSCQVTSEYNPVCGTNNVTYNNPGRLECAQNCGVDVRLLRPSPCPRPTPPPDMNAGQNPTTATPANTPTSPRQPVQPVEPTRFTNVVLNPGTTANPQNVSGSGANNNGMTIAPDVLASIFTNPTTESDEDIDVRDDERLGN